MDELIEEFNKLNKDYEFEPESVFLDLKSKVYPANRLFIKQVFIHFSKR